MAITKGGKISGSVSGGCVEGAVVEAASDVLKSHKGQLLHFGVADETAWEVGLACGGSIDVFVNPVDTTLHQLVRTAIIESEPISILTVVGGPVDLIGSELLIRQDTDVVGSIGPDLDPPAIEAARAALTSGHSVRAEISDPATGQQIEVYIDVLLPSPVLIAVGGAHISIALVAIARTLGWHTIVIDPRSAFGSAERFPHADRLIKLWPDKALAMIGITRSTAIAVLTHDPKIDDPALIAALPGPAFYVGALGSTTTQTKRRKRLLDAGLSEADLNRLRGPIGLRIGAKSPEEIGLAIMAEIIAEREGQLAALLAHPVSAQRG
jgi:xanthine dehydrogenase accessory factor